MTQLVDLSEARTVGWYRHNAKRLGKRTWRGAMQAIAYHDGVAIALHGDDSLTIVKRDGKSTTYTPEQWSAKCPR